MKEQKLYSIDEIIDYISKTNETEWCVDKVRTGNKNCFFWHLHKMCKDDKEATFNWDMFEEIWATTYMIYPVNDGENQKYQQSTPKQRILAYLKDLKNGSAKTINQLMKEYANTI